MQIDPMSEGGYQNKTLLLNLFNYNNGTYFKLRPSTIYTKAPMFSFTDRKTKSGGSGARQSLLVSYPMFVKYTGLASARKVKYERLVLKMKPGHDSNDQ